jgi:hypothetical protein
MMPTSIDVQVTYGAPWLPGELILDGDGSPVVTLPDEIDSFGPEDVFCVRSDGETDETMLKMARDAGFNVIEG